MDAMDFSTVPEVACVEHESPHEQLQQCIDTLDASLETTLIPFVSVSAPHNDAACCGTKYGKTTANSSDIKGFKPKLRRNDP
jgi:hypothetical protein